MKTKHKYYFLFSKWEKNTNLYIFSISLSLFLFILVNLCLLMSVWMWERVHLSKMNMKFGNCIKFSINIFFWYGFTTLSTIFSKKYLNLTNDSHMLTLVTFLYPTVIRIFYKHQSMQKLKSQLFSSHVYFYLGFFNISTILLTNIGMNETSVSLTYMVKVRIAVLCFLLLLFLNFSNARFFLSQLKSKD